MIRRSTVIFLLALAPVLAGCPAPPAAPQWASDMLASLNANRANAGLAPLSMCRTLSTAAQGHSADQAARRAMGHIGATGSTMAQRAKRASYRGGNALGENVAAGHPDVDSVMNGWMNSPGHRANILSGSFTHLGVGQAAASDAQLYWTLDFGRGGTC